MSKDRARRRAEREAAAAVERERRRRQLERRRRRERLVDAVRAPLTRSRRPRVDSALTRQRRRQDAVLLMFLIALHVVVWLVSGSWLVRASALTLTLMTWPVLTTVLFDRRTRL